MPARMDIMHRNEVQTTRLTVKQTHRFYICSKYFLKFQIQKKKIYIHITYNSYSYANDGRYVRFIICVSQELINCKPLFLRPHSTQRCSAKKVKHFIYAQSHLEYNSIEIFHSIYWPIVANYRPLSSFVPFLSLFWRIYLIRLMDCLHLRFSRSSIYSLLCTILLISYAYIADYKSLHSQSFTTSYPYNFRIIM